MDTHLDLAPCFYFSCRDDGTLISINNTLATRLGYTVDELKGQKIDILFTIATRIFQQTHFFPLLKMQGYANEIFITLQSKEKQPVSVLLNADYKEEQGEKLITLVGIEVHNRKLYEDELIAAKNAAQKALDDNTALVQAKQDLERQTEYLDGQVARVNKQNKELMQFNKVITHDLQEPLRKMTLFTNMLQDADGRLPTEDTIKRLLAVSAHMRTVVSGLQQYIWLSETGMTLGSVNLNESLQQAIEKTQKEHPGVQLKAQFGDLPAIYADEAQINVLLQHLLSNAIRFRKDKDEAIASLSAHKLVLNKFRHVEGRYKYTEFLKLTVHDNGIGFNPEYKDQVFQLFRRLHPESGSGIGLALCRKIVDNHHGEIFIDSTEGKGTTVSILLPTSITAPQQTPQIETDVFGHNL